MAYTSVVHFLSENIFFFKIKREKIKIRSNDYTIEINLQVQCSKQIFKNILPNTDGNPLIATPENCNLPVNCNYLLQPNQAYYKSIVVHFMIMIVNQQISMSWLGWFKMHDVFRNWLPGHFWEGLYVK